MTSCEEKIEVPENSKIIAKYVVFHDSISRKISEDLNTQIKTIYLKQLNLDFDILFSEIGNHLFSIRKRISIKLEVSKRALYVFAKPIKVKNDGV